MTSEENERLETTKKNNKNKNGKSKMQDARHVLCRVYRENIVFFYLLYHCYSESSWFRVKNRLRQTLDGYDGGLSCTDNRGGDEGGMNQLAGEVRLNSSDSRGHAS